MDINKIVQEKALKKLKIDEIVMEILPQMREEIKRELIREIKSMEYQDFLYDVLQSKIVVEAFAKKISKVFK